MNDNTPTVLTEGPADGTDGLDLDDEDRNYLLSNPARRAVVAVLAESASSMTLTDLASEIAGSEGKAAGDADSRDLEVVLHHNHLPRLADAGLLEYDPGANRVQPRAISVHG